MHAKQVRNLVAGGAFALFISGVAVASGAPAFSAPAEGHTVVSASTQSKTHPDNTCRGYVEDDYGNWVYNEWEC